MRQRPVLTTFVRGTGGGEVRPCCSFRLEIAALSWTIGSVGSRGNRIAGMATFIACRTRTLSPAAQLAAERAIMERHPEEARPVRGGRGDRVTRIAVNIGNRWPAAGVRLTVSFLDGGSVALRKRILEHMNAWSKSANVRFREARTDPDVRITRVDSPPEDAGYWSYLGTEILGAEADEPTMNLEGFTARTSEAEYRRVVRHEAGHTLGFEHEHMRSEFVRRIDRRKAIRYFRKTDGWTPEEVREQVLTPLEETSIMGSAGDEHSIMCYQIPGEITKDGQPIMGGIDIDRSDFAFAASIYPKRGR